MLRKCLALLLSALTLVVPATATTYTVKAGGGGNYTTISACASVTVAGDTCVIYAGTYNETVSPKNSGSAGSPITYSTNPGDAVTVSSWNTGTLSYVVVKGTAAAPMTITGSFGWTVANNNTLQYLSLTGGGCVGGNGWYSSGQPSSHNQFLNMTVDNCGGSSAGPAFELEGHYNLFDGITCTFAQACITLSGQFNVIRNSNFGPTAASVLGGQHSQPVENSVSCAGGAGHADIAGGMQHLLYENNVSNQWRGGNSHGIALVTDTGSTVCGTTSNLFRLSSTMDSGSYSTEIYSSLQSYFLNDSFSDTQQDASPKDKEDYQFSPSAPNSRTINNIFYNMTQAGSVDWCIYAVTPLVENHNLCFNTGWTGAWSGPSTASGSSYDPSDIFNKDPMFVAPDSNLQLQAGSPAVNTGGGATTTVGSGSNSTALTVADAGFFSWGYGIPNVQADWIRIGATTTVQISNINYSTNVITLASPVSWSASMPVYLYRNSNGTVVLGGANPNMGAFPVNGTVTSQPLPPTGLAATLGSSPNSITLNWTQPSQPSGETIASSNLYKNGVKLTNVLPTVLKYVDTAVTAGTTYSYSVTNVDTNGFESALSPAVSATIPATSSAPVITTQPISQAVTTGQSVTFSVVASGTTPLTYQWRVGGAAIAGATQSSYALTAAASNTGSIYSVVVSNSLGSVTSTNATLTVTAVPGLPQIGNTISVVNTANIRGTAPTNALGTLLGTQPSGAMGTVTMSPIATTLGWYWVFVKFSATTGTPKGVSGYMGSDNMTIVTPSVGVSLSPSSATVQTGGTVTFVATVTGSTNTAVTWSANAPGGVFTAPATPGQVLVTATSVADSTKSASVMVTVTAPPVTLNCPVVATAVGGGYSGESVLVQVSGGPSCTVTIP